MEQLKKPARVGARWLRDLRQINNAGLGTRL